MVPDGEELLPCCPQEAKRPGAGLAQDICCATRGYGTGMWLCSPTGLSPGFPSKPWGKWVSHLKCTIGQSLQDQGYSEWKSKSFRNIFNFFSDNRAGQSRGKKKKEEEEGKNTHTRLGCCHDQYLTLSLFTSIMLIFP